MATAAQFKHKKTLGDNAEHFVKQMIERGQGIRFGHGGAMEEGSDIAYLKLDGRMYGVEVKAIRSFLTRDNTGLLSCGAIPFEIMNKDQTEEGWLYKWLFPAIWMMKRGEQEERPAVRPERVHFVLYDNTKERRHPFCVVSFENTRDLFDYLHGAGKEWGWNILDPMSWSLDRLKAICSMGGKTEIELPGKQYIVKGKSDGEEAAFCWYVPTNKIISAARVTMVGDQPHIEPTHKYEKHHPIPGGDAGFQALQQARYDYLHQHSKGQEITNAQLEEERKRAAIYEQHAILNLE